MDEPRADTRGCCSAASDTPPTYSGDADLSRVHAVVDADAGGRPPRARHEEHRAGRARARSIKRAASGQGGFRYVSCPEFLKEGSAVDGLPASRPRRDRRRRRRRWAADARRRASTRRSARAIVRTDVASAEMIKLASNAFLATKISFINEIANVCEEIGADVARGRARAWGSTTASGRSSCRRGLAIGGSCLPATRRSWCAAAGGRRCCGSSELWRPSGGRGAMPVATA